MNCAETSWKHTPTLQWLLYLIVWSQLFNSESVGFYHRERSHYLVREWHKETISVTTDKKNKKTNLCVLFLERSEYVYLQNKISSFGFLMRWYQLMEHVNHRICEDIEDVVLWKFGKGKKTTLSNKKNVLSEGKRRIVIFERRQHFGFDKDFYCLNQNFSWNECGLCKFYTLEPLTCIINVQTVLLRNICYGFFTFYKNTFQILKRIFPK
jgi:hypothetical protein